MHSSVILHFKIILFLFLHPKVAWNIGIICCLILDTIFCNCELTQKYRVSPVFGHRFLAWSLVLTYLSVN